MQYCFVAGMSFPFELERGVLQVEVAGKALAEPVQDLGRGSVCPDLVVDDVRGQDGVAAGDRPGVQVMAGQDAPRLANVPADVDLHRTRSPP